MYKLMPLPYSYRALEPDINEEEVTIHYDKHHRGYVNKLNEALARSNYDYKYSISEIPNHIDEFPLPDRGDILYNAGGVLNHNLYWDSMSSTKAGPKGKLLNKINIQYGNFEHFRKDFMDRAKYLAGSGYTFLVSNNHGDLTIMNMINQETPISYNLIPLFNIDLWEHAYYLQYKSDRNKYIENFWNKANFDYASEKYKKIVN